MTRTAEAFQTAGVKTTRQRLEEITLRAMIKHASSREAAEKEIWEAVRKSHALTLELLESWRHTPINILIDRVKMDAMTIGYCIAADRNAPVIGFKPNSARELRERSEYNAYLDAEIAKSTPLQRRAAMVAQAWSQREEAERVEWQREQDELDRKRCEASYQNWMRRNGYEEIDGKPVKITVPFYVQVNHKPFWTVTVNEARGWIDRTSQEARFMELVIAGVPDDGRPIEYYRRPEEIDDLWKRAETA
jgi:hypothetical protein